MITRLSPDCMGHMFNVDTFQQKWMPWFEIIEKLNDKSRVSENGQCVMCGLGVVRVGESDMVLCVFTWQRVEVRICPPLLALLKAPTN